MEMINRCLDVSADKRAELEEYDRRHQRRKEMLEQRVQRREMRELSGEFGNRKERRRQAALERQR